MIKQFTFRAEESPGEKAEREQLDKLVEAALQRHLETHMQVFGYPSKDWESMLQEAIALGCYNGKTLTYNTPLGTITLHGKVGAPND